MSYYTASSIPNSTLKDVSKAPISPDIPSSLVSQVMTVGLLLSLALVPSLLSNSEPVNRAALAKISVLIFLILALCSKQRHG